MTTNELTICKTGKVFQIKVATSCKSSNIVYIITCRRCGEQYVGETGQPLHYRINSHCFDIRQRRTEESPVAEHVNTARHTLADMTVVAIDQLYSHNTCFCEHTRKQVNQDPGNLTSFRNEPQGGFFVKPV